MNANSSSDAVLGCLLGTAVGDALGLPSERLSKRRIAALWKDDLRHRFILGKGMFSDDTEHTLMVAAAMLAHGTDAAAFQRTFAWKLRWWMLALPAGVGLSTAKAILRLWLGFPATRSGVRSGGNGAAMRSAIIGVMYRDDAAKRREFTLAACRVTHTGPHAEESAQLVAEAAALASHHAPVDEVLEKLGPLVASAEMKSRFAAQGPALRVEKSVADYAAEIGCGRGVSGFAPNSVAVALYAWLRHRGQFAEAVQAVIACGGDTDTVAAITGGICGAEVGEEGIPKEWLNGLCDWQRSVKYIRQLAAALAEKNGPSPSLFWPAVPVRNLFFLLVVLLHGFRRLLPPY